MNENLDYVKERIKACQKRLLDTSKRNKLISFKHSERSHQHVRVINAQFDSLYYALLEGDKPLKLLPLPDPEKSSPDEEKEGFLNHLSQADSADNEPHLNKTQIAHLHQIDPSYEMAEPNPREKENGKRPEGVQTFLFLEEMNKKVRKLKSYVTTDIQESGVNTLHIAFGFLEWYESRISGKELLSPLLSLEINLKKERSIRGEEFLIQANSESVEVNLSLSKILSSEFGIELPSWTEGDCPESYLKKVNLSIKDGKQDPRWKVRRFITIGRFHFARLVMYHDLCNENRSNGQAIWENKIVQTLFGGSDHQTSGDHAGEYNVDTPEVEEIVPLLFTPADASQHSVLVNVMKGDNLAIQGPPGTGKSQTITNIIANALYKGKSVLFLAEKKAALDVVFARLCKGGLDPFCLELHSTKANKREVLNSIKQRLELDRMPNDQRLLSLKSEDFKRQRELISEYTHHLHSKWGSHGKSVYDHLWKFLKCKDRFSGCPTKINECKIPFENADLSEIEKRKHLDYLEKIAALKKQVDDLSKEGEHPWGFVDDLHLNPVEQSDLKIEIKAWKGELETVQEKLGFFNKEISRVQEKIKALNQELCFSLKSKEFESAFHSLFTDLSDANLDQLEGSLLVNLEAKDKNIFYALFETIGSFKSILEGNPSRENTQVSCVKNLVDRLEIWSDATALSSFIRCFLTYKSNWDKIQFIKRDPTILDQIEGIEKKLATAKETQIDQMSLSKIAGHILDLEREQKQQCETVQSLINKLNLGQLLQGIEKESLSTLSMAAQLPELIASLTYDELLLTRNPHLIDKKKSPSLEEAVEIEKRYDLSGMVNVDEISKHIDALSQAGSLRFLNRSYWQAKQFLRKCYKPGTKFNWKESAEDLRIIEDISKKIGENRQLQQASGSSSRRLETNFKRFLDVNRWAVTIREQYISGHPFSKKLGEWLLETDVDKLNLLGKLAGDPLFVELKSRMEEIRKTTDPNITLEAYFSQKEERLDQIKVLNQWLESNISSEAATFANLSEDLPHLQQAKGAKEKAYQEVERQPRKEPPHFEPSSYKELQKMWLRVKDQIGKLGEVVKSQIKRAESIFNQFNLSFRSCYLSQKTTFLDIDLTHLIKRLAWALEEQESLRCWIEFEKQSDQTDGEITGRLIQTYKKKRLDFSGLPSAFDYITSRSSIDEISKSCGGILEAEGASLEIARDRIKRLDQETSQLRREELLHKLSLDKPLEGERVGSKKTWSEGALLHDQVNRQRGHLPIKELIRRAGKSVQKMKPCFLMSPLAVAQYLEPDGSLFDLVIIDEASQMRTEDALGSIVRTKQLIVVGDPKQLPPTSFFQSEPEEEEEEEDLNEESIMDLALAAFRPFHMLSRHYRSEHESLIAFSNHHFYNRNLLIFPSPVESPDELGIKSIYVSDGIYKSSLNEKEAEVVVKHALEFMKRHPNRSLGIGTMNAAQESLIEDKMESAFMENRDADQYRNEWESTLEPFFVKKIESIQGDERDAIFISTVYGKGEGKEKVHQNFGPINRIGGHRRLNVLFSRAKKNMVVFTSLKAEDIKTTERSSEGVRAFKGFLAYAATGMMDMGDYDSREIDREPDSDFEIYVKDRLGSIGCEVHPQVGVSGYWIDLGIKHPKYPHGYLMGIECDGAFYHSSKSARERDVIRQKHLEGLGWRIYRIWSTDWFSDTDREFRKLRSYIEELLKKANPPQEVGF